MKKLIFAAAALFLLSLAACSDSAAPVPSDGDAQTEIPDTAPPSEQPPF